MSENKCFCHLNGYEVKDPKARNNICNLKEFSAIEGKTECQADIILNAINYCIEKNIGELRLNGSYFVNKTISLSNISNLKITNGTLFVHEDDELLSANYNVFEFINCSNIIIDNINVIEINPVARTRILQVGGLLFKTCNKCKVYNCYLENLASGIMFIGDSENCIAENNTIDTPFQSPQFSQSAILVYASSHNIIKYNKIYGEYYDGNLSIFGGKSNDNIVSCNELNNKSGSNTPIWLSQGITIDQGPKRTIVSNNIITGMFYGIDNKADTYFTNIHDNMLFGCKCAIADRRGESPQANHSIGATIINNKITIANEFDVSLGTFMLLGKYYYTGILSENRFNANIKNNYITVFGTITETVLGIYCHQANEINAYNQIFDVSGNNIELATGILAISSTPPENSTGIHIKNVTKGKFNENTLKVDKYDYIYTMFEISGNNNHLQISNNHARGSNASKHRFIKYFDTETTVVNSSNVNNKLCLFGPDNLAGVSNQNMIDNSIVNRCKTVAVTSEWSDVLKFSYKNAGTIVIKLSAFASFSGIQYIDCQYMVNINGTNVSVTEIYNNNQNLEVQFINDGTSNTATMQIKSYASFNLTNLDIVDFKQYGTYTIEEL